MNYYDIADDRNAVIQIQKILRNIEFYENGYSSVPLNGVFNDNTQTAVKNFQKNYGLAPTGKVDSETWYSMLYTNEQKTHASHFPRPVHLFPKTENFAIYPMAKNDAVYIIQYMLSTIEPEYDDFDNIEFTGVYDEKTQNAIRNFQRKNFINSDGTIDVETINRLFDEYEHTFYSDI